MFARELDLVLQWITLTNTSYLSHCSVDTVSPYKIRTENCICNISYSAVYFIFLVLVSSQYQLTYDFNIPIIVPGADKSLARPTSRCTFFDGENIYFDAILSIYRVSQEERTKLRESVPYVKVYRYNPKHLYSKLNGYGDNGKRSLKFWQLLHTYWL